MAKKAKVKKSKFEGVPNVNPNGEIHFTSGSSANFVLGLYIKHKGDSKKMTDAIIKAEKSGNVNTSNPAARVIRVISEIHMLEKKHGARVPAKLIA